MACSPARPPALDPCGRGRVLETARDHELRARRDLADVPRAAPACAPPRGHPPKARPECPPAAREEQPDEHKDCPCEVKGACKKVRFSDEALPEDDSRCTRAPAPPAPRRRCDGDHEPGAPHDSASPRQRDKDGRLGRQPHAPCDCPCWAAYSPSPPTSLATTDIYRTCRLPKRFQYPAWFSGYNTGPKHPLYRTTASEIGRHPPTVHTVSTIFRPVDRTMSKMYSAAGPWRNRSLCNTGAIWDVYSYHNFY